ncbi:MAG: PorV/PorQ family protein [bacterium]|nr:MAG: PorV/PorQ family protein [bacterium]
MRSIKSPILGLSTIVLLFLNVGNVIAQGNGYGGTHENFTLGVGARALALGNAYVAVPYDATAIYWNPAGLDHIQYKNACLFYTNLLYGSQYYFLGYVHPTINFGTLGAGVIGISAGDIEEYGENAVPGGIASYGSYQFLFSYGKQLPFYKDVSVGLNLKINHHNFSGFILSPEIGTSATGIGTDVGILYRPDFNNIALSGLSLGVTVQNLLGSRLKMDSYTDVHPINLRFGLAKPILRNEWGNQFTIFMDFEQGVKVPFEYHFGTEYVFQNLAMLRVGMNNNQLSFGAGAVFHHFQLDYSFGKFAENEISSSHRISFTIKLGKSKQELIRLAEERRYLEAQRIARQQVEFERNKKIAESMERGKAFVKEEDYARALSEFNIVTSFENEMPGTAVIKEAKKLADFAAQKNEEEMQNRIREIEAKNIEEERREKNKIRLNNYFKQGMAYFENEEYGNAIEEWNKMLEIDPENELAKQYIAAAKTENEQKILSLMTRAESYGQSRKFIEAISELNKARRMNPNERQIKLIEQRINDYEQQMNFIELFQQGYTYYIQKDYQNAMVSFKNALSIQPGDKTVNKYYNDAEARANARKEPMTPSVKKRYYEGVKLFTAGKYEEALRIWEEIQKIQRYNKDILDGIDLARERIEQQRKGSKNGRN